MALKKIKYVTEAELAALISGGTVEEGVDYRVKDADIVIDTKINGTSIVDANGVANIPIADASNLGVSKVLGAYGVQSVSNILAVNKALDQQLEQKTDEYRPVVSSNLNKAVMEGLGNNSLTWSDAYKASARNTIGAGTPHIVRVYNND